MVQKFISKYKMNEYILKKDFLRDLKKNCYTLNSLKNIYKDIEKNIFCLLRLKIRRPKENTENKNQI